MTLRYSDVSFSYNAVDGVVRALSGVSLEVAPGELVAVVGANGSGKSTLARLANGLQLPSHGSVTVDAMATDDPAHVYDIRSRVGMVFQHPDDQIVATSVEDDIAFGPENLGLSREIIRERVDAAIAATGMKGLERREPHQLSGGQKQRLAIAGALAMRPRYLVLDEPTSMLDPAGRAEVIAVVAEARSAGHGILLITHDLVEAALADRAVVLSGGTRVFDGAPHELLGDARLTEWSLDKPPVLLLAEELRRLGVPVPSDALTPPSIAEALCR